LIHGEFSPFLFGASIIVGFVGFVFEDALLKGNSQQNPLTFVIAKTKTPPREERR
jgi:hypothetical protein